jgi:hypothetical protein
MVSIVDATVGVLFALLALAIIAWIARVLPELASVEPFKGVFGMIFAPVPAKSDVDKAALPVKFTVERIIPIIFWLLILLPMIIFPIVLIIFPLLGLPWSYLLPPVP